MKLSSRLRLIGDLVKEDAKVIDVGADHGLLEKYLIDERNIKYIQAVENKPAPYESLKKNLKGYDVNFTFGDGLDKMNSCVDTIVIAGMGGYLIKDILTRDVRKLNDIKQIVVDAHNDIDVVRSSVVDLNFKIEKEIIIHENGIYYFVISFVKGSESYSDDEIEFGYEIGKDPLFKEYQEKELARLTKNLIMQKRAKIIKPEEIEKLESKIERLAKL